MECVTSDALHLIHLIGWLRKRDIAHGSKSNGELRDDVRSFFTLKNVYVVSSGHRHALLPFQLILTNPFDIN